MNYEKIYNNLINSRLLLKGDRFLRRNNGEYFEGHHIIPKSKGGKGTSSKGLKNANIVYLTAREHFLAHWILWRIHRDRSSALSFHKMMSFNKNQKRITSAIGYEEARLAFRESNKGNKYSLGKTKIITEEQKKYQSDIMKGRYLGSKNPFFGKKHSEEALQRMRNNKKTGVVIRKEKRVIEKDGFKHIFNNNHEVASFLKCSINTVKVAINPNGNTKLVRGYKVYYE